MAKKRFQTSLEILEKLVSFKTISKDSNLELIEFVEEYFKSFGLESYRVYDKTGKKADRYYKNGLMKLRVKNGIQKIFLIKLEDMTKQ